MSRPRLVLALVVLPWVFAATAAAQTVEHGVEQVDVAGLAQGLSNACGFPLYAHTVGTNKFTDFLDENGLIVRDNTEVHYSMTITNPPNGKTVTTERHFVVHWIGQDLFSPNEVVESMTLTGNLFSITVPGLGTILQNTGRLVRAGRAGPSLFEAGQHDLLDGNTDAFCAYMAAP